MADQKKKPGPRKGVTKRLRRPLDPGFPDRLKEAMRRREFVRDGHYLNAELAREVECTHQVIGQYLGGKKRSIDPYVLLNLCDALSVSPYWLIRKEGTIDDVELGKRPFEETRRRITRPTPAEEGANEIVSEGTRSARHVARARRTTAG